MSYIITHKGKNGFSFIRDSAVIEAKYGLVLPKIK